MRHFLICFIFSYNIVSAQILLVDSKPTIFQQNGTNSISLHIQQFMGGIFSCQFGIKYRKINSSTWYLGRSADGEIFTFSKHERKLVTISNIVIDGQSGDYEFSIFYTINAKGITKEVAPYEKGSLTDFPHPFVLNVSNNSLTQLYADLLGQIQDGLSQLKYATSTYLFLFNSVDEVTKQLDIEKIKNVQTAIGKAQSILKLVNDLKQITNSNDPVISYFLCMKLLAGNVLPKPFSTIFTSYAEVGIAFKEAIDRIIDNNGPRYFREFPEGFHLVIKYRKRDYQFWKDEFFTSKEIQKFVLRNEIIIKTAQGIIYEPLAHPKDESRDRNEIVFDLFSSLENKVLSQFKSTAQYFIRVTFMDRDYIGKVIDGQQIIIPLEDGFVTKTFGSYEVRIGIDIRAKTEADLQTDRKTISLFKF